MFFPMSIFSLNVSLGGPQLTLPAGPKDQHQIAGRADMLIFASEPLSAPLEITGRVRAKLWASSDAPDTDFFVRLCDVYPDGRSLNICEGRIRARFHESFGKEKLLKPGEIYGFEIDLVHQHHLQQRPPPASSFHKQQRAGLRCKSKHW